MGKNEPKASELPLACSLQSLDTRESEYSIFHIQYPLNPCGVEIGRSWIRTSEGVSQQIYSLPRLATSVSARKEERLAKKAGAVKNDPKEKTWLPVAVPSI